MMHQRKNREVSDSNMINQLVDIDLDGFLYELRAQPATTAPTVTMYNNQARTIKAQRSEIEALEQTTELLRDDAESMRKFITYLQNALRRCEHSK